MSGPDHPRCDNVRRLTGQKLEEISIHIPEPPSPAAGAHLGRLPHAPRSTQKSKHFRHDDSDTGSDTSSELDDPDAHSDQSSEDSHEDLHQIEAETSEQIQKLQEQLRILTQQLVEAKTELALEQSKRPPDYDDYYFKVLLDQLRHDIRQWCCTYFSDNRSYITRSADRRFRGLTHNWAAYLENSRWRPWLIQARLWDQLQCYIFDEYSKRQHYFLFAGPDKEYAVDKLFSQASRNGSQASRRAYREWRASTFSLLFPGKGSRIEPASYMEHIVNDRIIKLRYKIWRSLRSYATATLTRDERHDAKSRLFEILERAMHLDLDLKKHTMDILLTFERPIFGSEFDPARMEEALGQNSTGVVELIVSPPLYKETDLPGGRVERRILRRPQVCSIYVQRAPQMGVDKALAKVYTRCRGGDIDQPPLTRGHTQKGTGVGSRESLIRGKRVHWQSE